jgi:Predicted AAA-ATPase
MLKTLPIGNDQFRLVREINAYYVDKSMMIKDFLEYRDVVALVTRPRRFGKTLNMTMLKEFFDITKNSCDIFHGLGIMDTEYANLINTKPVIYFSFKDCSRILRCVSYSFD